MYRYTLRNFLNKDDMKMSAKCMSYFIKKTLCLPFLLIYIYRFPASLLCPA